MCLQASCYAPLWVFFTHHQPFGVRNAASPRPPLPPSLPLTPSIFLGIENYLDFIPWPYQIRAVRSLFLPHFVLCACPRAYALALALTLARSFPPPELLCLLYFFLRTFSPRTLQDDEGFQDVDGGEFFVQIGY